LVGGGSENAIKLETVNQGVFPVIYDGVQGGDHGSGADWGEGVLVKRMKL